MPFERYFIMTPVGKVADANTKANVWEKDTGRGKTFGVVQLSADGLEPATFTACCTLMDDQMLAELMKTGEGLTFSKILAERDGWNWEKALEAMGLREIRRDIDGRVIEPKEQPVDPKDTPTVKG